MRHLESINILHNSPSFSTSEATTIANSAGKNCTQLVSALQKSWAAVTGGQIWLLATRSEDLGR